MTDFVVPYRPRAAAAAEDRLSRAAAMTRPQPARIARQLAVAHALQARVDTGEFADYARLAEALGFTRARVTQLMNLLLLAPDLQERLLFLETRPGLPLLDERRVRPVLRTAAWVEQRRIWRDLRLDEQIADALDSSISPRSTPRGRRSTRR